MKTFFLFLFCIISVFGISQSDKDIKLPKPIMKGGMPLMEALKNRQTLRDFSEKKLSTQQLSNLLWAAYGINRPESGKRTAPSAVNWQEIDIYVALEKGTYKYSAKDNKLIFLNANDVRKNIGKQTFTKKAAVCLAYISDYKKMKTKDEKKDFYSATDTGFISQNVYLYCASENMATVVLGYINRDKIREVLGLEEHQKVVLTQCVCFEQSEFN